MGQKRPSRGSKKEARGNSTKQRAQEKGKADWIEHKVSNRSLVLRLHSVFFSIFGVLGVEIHLRFLLY